MENICCSAFNRLETSLRVRIADFQAPCFFFRKRGEEFHFKEIIPKGVCPALFFHIYPQYLALLYGGMPAEITIDCPGIEGKTIWRLRSKKLLISPVIELVRKIFNLIGRPKDLFDRKITMELLEKEGFCPHDYENKVHFSFNQYSHIWGRRFFCPAAFYAIYPFIISEKPRDAEGPLRIQCPSHIASIMFEIIQ